MRDWYEGLTPLQRNLVILLASISLATLPFYALGFRQLAVHGSTVRATTPTVEATAQASPSETGTPTPTATPVFTATEEPTPVPRPTATPEPTPTAPPTRTAESSPTAPPRLPPTLTPAPPAPPFTVVATVPRVAPPGAPLPNPTATRIVPGQGRRPEGQRDVPPTPTARAGPVEPRAHQESLEGGAL